MNKLRGLKAAGVLAFLQVSVDAACVFADLRLCLLTLVCVSVLVDGSVHVHVVLDYLRGRINPITASRVPMCVCYILST